MARRRRRALLILAAVAGTMFAAGAASANVPASARLAHPTAPQTGGTVAVVSPGQPDIPPAGAARPGVSGAPRTPARSTNWSGYAVARGAGAYRSVSASWVEPAATCHAGGGARYAAFWVGLDGYHSSSVEQAGTDSDCQGRTADYYGWYEMYPDRAIRLAARVRPGDQVSASVTFGGRRTYRLVLTDRTRRWTRVIVKNEAGLARSSAEVITEAPSSRSGVLALADFGTIRFTAPRVNGAALGRVAPVRIVMTDGSGRDKDRTSPIGPAGAFSNVWLRSN